MIVNFIPEDGSVVCVLIPDTDRDHEKLEGMLLRPELQYERIGYGRDANTGKLMHVSFVVKGVQP